MKRLVRSFLAVEAATFGAASLVHTGRLVTGYEHGKAAIAEGVIGAVLLAALIASIVAPRVSRAVGIGAQAFALLGTLVGITTMAIGVGPQTGADVALHVCLVIMLVTGIVLARRASPRA